MLVLPAPHVAMWCFVSCFSSVTFVSFHCFWGPHLIFKIFSLFYLLFFLFTRVLFHPLTVVLYKEMGAGPYLFSIDNFLFALHILDILEKIVSFFLSCLRQIYHAHDCADRVVMLELFYSMIQYDKKEN